MKVKVKAPFFDENGIHKRGEICDVANFRPEFMELIGVEEKKDKVEKAIKTDAKKTTRKKD